MKKKIKKAIKKGFSILVRPEKEFSELYKRSFENDLIDYLLLLVTVGVVAGIVSFLFYIIKAFYLNLFLTINIQYWRMINYSFGRTTSLIFFYLFAGMFLMLIVSVVLKPFFRSIKYTHFLQILFYSLTPFLLFSWLPFLLSSLIVWSVFLFVIGIRSYRPEPIKKDSIKHRD